MKLSALIKRAGIAVTTGEDDPEITGLCADSRQVKAGSLFVAVKGVTVDGHDFIGKAIEQGAAAIVMDNATLRDSMSTVHWPLSIIVIPDSAVALGRLASVWFGEPSRQLIVVGVTGTNGKTTVATLLYELFRKLGFKAGLLSTICNCINDDVLATDHTTPDALTIQQLMAMMVNAGCDYVFMEVSSHAVDQKRISGIDFNGGIFTNLTRDHMDYHLTTENYLKAKKSFFDHLPPTAFALTNVDDKNGMVMLQNTAARRLTYSLQTPADFKGKIIESHFEGTEMEINRYHVFTRFTGRFNAYNLLAVYGAAVACASQESDRKTIDPEEIIIALSALHPVSGRFETIRLPQGVTAIVDYAHTPDALENVLNSIHDVLDGNGRIITVVGAGGNRDKGKRPMMAKVASNMSDQLILTSDNPRFENPEDIIHDMYAGITSTLSMGKSGGETSPCLCITDRRQAIKTAIALAKKGDVILIAGKGHENYQEIKGVKYPFDDKEILLTINN